MDFPHTSSPLVLFCLPSGRCGWTPENTVGHLSRGTRCGEWRAHLPIGPWVVESQEADRNQECWEGRRVLGRVKPGGCEAASGSSLGGWHFLARVTWTTQNHQAAAPLLQLKANSSLKAVRELPSLGDIPCYFIWGKTRGSRVAGVGSLYLGEGLVVGDALG